MSDKEESGNSFETAVRAAGELGLRFLAGESELPRRDQSPDLLAERLGIPLTAHGHSFDEVVGKLGGILSQTPSAASPRFLNQLFGGRDAAATLAEMLVPLSNTSMYTYKVAGAQVLVEREILRKMLAAVPYPDGEGMFSPGGSLANLTAMVIARNEALENVRNAGLQGERPTVYTSADAHYSIRKAAGILGIGRDNVREIPTDGAGAMIPSELERRITLDERNGRLPILVNATAGTTVLGAIDPLAEIARIAAARGIWMHVDGALAASLLLSRKYRHRLDGIAEADSITWNAHKMMSVPLPCSVLLVRRQRLLEEHLGESAGYLFQADESTLNPGTRSLQCGRRNDALKLWAAWQYLGDEGFDRRLTHLVDLARRTADLVDGDPELELAAPPHSVNVCLRVRGVDSARICDSLDRSATLKIGHGAVRGESAIRIVCVAPDLDEARIVAVLGEIKKAAATLRAPVPAS